MKVKVSIKTIGGVTFEASSVQEGRVEAAQAVWSVEHSRATRGVSSKALSSAQQATVTLLTQPVWCSDKCVRNIDIRRAVNYWCNMWPVSSLHQSDKPETSQFSRLECLPGVNIISYRSQGLSIGINGRLPWERGAGGQLQVPPHRSGNNGLAATTLPPSDQGPVKTFLNRVKPQ